MNQIHPSAVVGKNVKFGRDNQVGPHVVIEDGAEIGSGNVFWAGAYVCGGTLIGDSNEIHMGAVIGHVPQDVAFKTGVKSSTRIGSRNIFREHVTIHRGTKEGTETVIGSDNFFMAGTHVAHNCIVGDRVTLVNLASLTGYCVIEDQAFISGMVGLHQFTRVGRLAILSALSAFNKDVPPYVLCGGRPGRAQGINVIGLRRAGIKPDVRQEIRRAFKILYRSGLNVSQALDAIEKEMRSEEVRHFVRFIRDSKRGIIAAADEAVEMQGVADELGEE